MQLQQVWEAPMFLTVDFCQLSCFDTEASISVRLTCQQQSLKCICNIFGA